MLTVKDVAELKGCGERWIQRLIGAEKLTFITVVVDGIGPGRGGIQYRIPLSALDDKLQLKYKRIQRKKEKAEREAKKTGLMLPDEDGAPISGGELTGEEKEEIMLWKLILKEWNIYRHMSPLPKDGADGEYIELCNKKYPKLKLSRRILYRKWKLMQEGGETALLNRRGKHEGHSRKLTPEMWDIFEYFYLDMSCLSAKLCRDLTEAEIKKSGLNLGPVPSVATFNRAADKIPEPYIHYFRYGEKVYKDKSEGYIERMYENLEPNDIWVADNHTFDIMIYDGAKPIRLYLTAFMDVRTRKMMGWCVTDRPSGDATIYALRNGIAMYGIPKEAYTDNGREFLFRDFGGNGFRKKKAAGTDDTEQPTILKDLGIAFKTAIPRNARAKGIERAFRSVKETFSKLFDAYTGGNILEKPDRLKEVVKNPDRMAKIAEFTGFVDTYIRGWYNKQPHSGDGMYNKSPDEMFAALLVEQRTATAAQLELMTMRWSKPVTVGKNGVSLTFYGQKLTFSDDYLWTNYKGKEVFVRYKPDDLSQVRVYDLEQRFICVAKLEEKLGYDAKKEEIAKKQQEKKSRSRLVTNYLKQKNVKAHSALELILDKAAENLKAGEEIDPAVLIPYFDKAEMAMAVGSEFEANELTEGYDWTDSLDFWKNQEGDSDE